MERQYSLGIDIGGTKIAFGVVASNGKLLHRHELPSETRSADTLFNTVLNGIDFILEISQMTIDKFYGIGIGIPGMVDNNNGIAVSQNNIPWRKFPIIQRLKEELGEDVRIIIDNDVKAAAYAEYATRKLATNDVFTYVTISTGLAATTIINNSVLKGAGFSGEIGFIPVKVNNDYIRLESYAAGPAIHKAYAGAKSTKEVFRKSRSGDITAHAILKERAHALAVGLYSIICLLDPNLIVLGGSVAHHNPDFIVEIINQLNDYVVEEQKHILDNIIGTVLGGDNGVIGAGMLAFNL